MAQDDQIKETILDAAALRMIRFGYRKVSMDEIAQDLSMSKNTIYKHFPAKVDIAKHFFKQLQSQINRELTLIEEGTRDPLEVITKSIFLIQKQLAPWFTHFLSDIKTEIPELYQEFIDFRNEKIKDIRKLIEQGIRMKKVRNVHPAVAVGMYLGAIDQVLNPEFLETSKLSFPQALDLIVDIWSSGILPKK